MELNELKEKTVGLLILNKNILRNFEPKESLLNANINRWMKKGELISIKKGMFVLKDRYEKEPKKDLYLEYIANQLIQPSYLSVEYVLSKYQLLSEPANAFTSITTKATREKINSLGAFRYYSIMPALFTGYKIKYFNNSPVWEAEKSKALFDYIYLRFIKERIISSESIENLRINWENLDKKEFDNVCFYSTLVRSRRVKQVLSRIKEIYYA
ncbi:hypothetical protein D4R87_02670 [bacterium]|nr:MAG: hypothetical protein D4R87_02670 [bacterium]